MAGASLRRTDSVGRSAADDGLSFMGVLGLSKVAPFISLRAPHVPETDLLTIEWLLKAIRLGFRGTVERFGPGR